MHSKNYDGFREAAGEWKRRAKSYGEHPSTIREVYKRLIGEIDKAESADKPIPKNVRDFLEEKG
jgi:hypothetical protein